jgi:hypothetical protein
MRNVWKDKVKQAFEEYWAKHWQGYDHQKCCSKFTWEAGVAWALAEFEKATQVLADTTTKQKEA